LVKGKRSAWTPPRSKPMRRSEALCGATRVRAIRKFLTQLAEASGIETPTREDLARLDRKRKNKGSNDDWTHPMTRMPRSPR
jgi:hypothetical protein